MKKIFFLFAILIASFTSCTSDNVSDSKPETATVSVITVADATTKSENSKNIARGNIYAWVNSITLSAKNVATNTTVSDLFNLTGSYNSNSVTAFGLDNVLLGATIFNVISTTDSAKRLTLAPTSGNATTVLAGLKANNPYVIYKSGDVNYTVSNETNLITIPMTTEQGRILAVFQMDSNQDFRNNFKATINVSAEGETLVASQNVPISDNGLVSLEWSSDKSLDGKKLTYTVSVYPKNNNNNIAPTVYTIVDVIKASTSYSCLYTIDKNKAPKTNVDVKNIKFTWQEWIEAGCPTGNCQ